MGSHAPNSDISPDKFVEFEIATRPVPQIDPSNPKMISQGPSVCVFNKADPEEVLASWLFAQFLLTNDVQLGYAETEGYIPVTAKAQSDPAYLDYLWISWAKGRRRAGKTSALFRGHPLRCCAGSAPSGSSWERISSPARSGRNWKKIAERLDF
jgi:ABC-type glycerol-3-phosphate transport system substrate-binding protein